MAAQGLAGDDERMTDTTAVASAHSVNSAPSVTSALTRARAPFAWRGVALIALAAFAVEMAVSARYGYVRDELYFLTAGQHLAFGYVDQPPLTPLIARLSAVLSGNSLIGLRAGPALGMAFLVVATAAMSRELGAGRTGQLFAALAAAVCGEYLAAMHELTTTPADFVGWATLLLLVLRLLATEDSRWWLAIGLCVGVASEAKWNIWFLAGALACGLAVSSRDSRRLLTSGGWYLLAGCAIAAALAAPDLAWQAMHGWPNLAVFRALQGQAWQNRIQYWPAQILYTGPVLVPMLIRGLRWILRGRDAVAQRFRPAGIACVIVIVGLFVLGGKPYYPGGAYTFLYAVGAVTAEARLAGPGRSAAARLASRMVIGGALASFVALPVLPAAALHTLPVQKINYDLGEEIAWPKQVAQVASVYDGLPASIRSRTTILTGNYGEAAAIERYGPSLGLPEAYSGANNFWLWGPPPARDTNVIAVNAWLPLLRAEFADVRLAGTFSNGLGVSDDEQGVPIYVATGLRSSWATAWPAFRRYS